MTELKTIISEIIEALKLIASAKRKLEKTLKKITKK